jgi:hypothetical protein
LILKEADKEEKSTTPRQFQEEVNVEFGFEGDEVLSFLTGIVTERLGDELLPSH